MSNSETALTVIPKNELAIVAKQAGAKADKLAKTGHGFGIGALSGVVVLLGGAAAIPLALVVAPILVITGFVSLFGGGLTAAVLEGVEQKARNRQTEAVSARAERVGAMARSALEGAIADDTIRKGLVLRIVPQEETPKKVLVDSVKTIIDEDGKKKLNIRAGLLEEDGTSVDWMRFSTNDSIVSLEQYVTAFPKHVLESIRAEIPPADAEGTIAPEPPAVREQEKKLPRYTPSL